MASVAKTAMAVLYELLPCRPADAGMILSYLHENVRDFLSAVITGIIQILRGAKGLPRTYWFLVSAWFATLVIVLRHFSSEFVKMFVAATALILMFMNFDQKKRGDVSAYSVFNNFQRLIGAPEEQLEREMMNLRGRD